MLLRVLIATGSPQRAERFAALLADLDVLASGLCANESLWERLRKESYELIVADEDLLGAAPARTLRDLRELPENPEVVVVVGDCEPEHRTELLGAAAFAVLDREASREDVLEALGGILARRIEQAHSEQRAERGELDSRISDFASASPAMREFLALVRRVVDSDSTLLLQGETGVGKEYLGRAIHAESPRSSGPFVPVNCSALSESLLESELFGHAAGAFTGAQRARRGYFEQAHGGTLFLDEVGELTHQVQVKLLRVLQDHRLQPVGGESEIEVDVRLVAATNRNLAAEMESGRLRADLFYRLSVVTLEVPPLRSRREDIPNMVDSHVEHFRWTLNRPVEGVTDAGLELLVAYDWPGNVRELINVLERAVLLCEDQWISPGDLPEEIRGVLGHELHGADFEISPERELDDERILAVPYSTARKTMIDAFERRYLGAVLRRSNGRMRDAATLAGLNPRSLYAKMREHGLRKEAYRPKGPSRS